LKHVENSNKYIMKKFCVKFVTYQNYTKMHGPKNINYIKLRYLCLTWYFIKNNVTYFVGKNFGL